MGCTSLTALCAGDEPIAALVSGPSCSIDSVLHRTFNDYENITVQTSKKQAAKKENTTALSNNLHERRKMLLVSLQHETN